MSEEAATTDAPAAARVASKPKMAVLLGLIVAGLGSGGAVGAFVAGPILARKLAPMPVSAADSAARADSAKHGGGGEHDAKAGGKDEGASFMLDNLVLNPAGSGGGRYLLTSVSLRYADASLKDKLTARESEIRDVILNVLGTKAVEQLTDIAGRDGLKAEIRAKVDSLLGGKLITGVFFPQFVIQ